MLLFTKSRTEKQLQQFIRASSAVQDEVVYLETFRDRLRNEHFSDAILKEMQALVLEIYDKLSDIRLVLESVIQQNTGAKDYKSFKTWEETTHRMVLFNQLVSECSMFLERHRITEAALMNKLETILVKEKQEEARVAQKIGLYQKAVKSTATVATGIALLLGAGTATMPTQSYAAEASTERFDARKAYQWDKVETNFSGANDIYRMKKNNWFENFFKHDEIKKIFKNAEQLERVMFRLNNNDINDDELKIAFMKDGYINFLIQSNDASLAKKVYVASIYIGEKNSSLIKSYVSE